MKKVITYGTFDLLHKGHENLLRRAKALGDYLIVGVTGENYDRSRGKLNVRQSVVERIDNVRSLGLADEIIVEEYEGQKIEDIRRLGADIFAIGSDWIGKFDYLKEFCEVVYLERTKGISSTELRAADTRIVRIGVVGAGRIARRFVAESKFVSGVDVCGVLTTRRESAQAFADANELEFFTTEYEELLSRCDAVYVASPHTTHYDYAKRALKAGKHVLCEKPMTLSGTECRELYALAGTRGLVLMEAIKTAFCPAFVQLISIAKSGLIGPVVDIDASFSKLVPEICRETDPSLGGGAISEMGTYVLLPILLLAAGQNLLEMKVFSRKNSKGTEGFARGTLRFDECSAGFKVGIGAKTEGALVISGTKGYIYVPAPWWKTDYFEIRFEDLNRTRKYFAPFEGEGLRYEIFEFVRVIGGQKSFRVPAEISVRLAELIEQARKEQCF